MNAKLCLRMEGPTTYITDPETGQEKPFTFDFSYWSHDGFHTDENGEMQGDSDKYATQRKVFDDLGRDVLRSAFDGYNSCLFAYGQTGSGKSYSMVGYGKNRGIIPIVCEEMFKSIAENTDPTIKYEVLVSMLEIYNECVKDLLNPKNNPPGGLKIRSQKDIGVYVEDLLEVPVSSYEEIDAKMAEGTLNRSVASTKMNATSSRAHTVFSIVFCKKRSEMGLTSEVRRFSTYVRTYPFSRYSFVGVMCLESWRLLCDQRSVFVPNSLLGLSWTHVVCSPSLHLLSTHL